MAGPCCMERSVPDPSLACMWEQVSEYIPEVIAYIQRIIDKGYAYGGSVGLIRLVVHGMQLPSS